MVATCSGVQALLPPFMRALSRSRMLGGVAGGFWLNAAQVASRHSNKRKQVSFEGDGMPDVITRTGSQRPASDVYNRGPQRASDSLSRKRSRLGRARYTVS